LESKYGNAMTDFSDYIVFVDESGDHSLTSIDPEFPAFSLSFCILRKDEYIQKVVPSVQAFKFKYWGHDAVILHEHEIRKTKGDFAFLRTDRALREEFLEDLSQVMAAAPFSVIGSVIDKKRLIARYPKPWNPYQLGLHFCLERLLIFMNDQGQRAKTLHVIFECRGKDEDAALELEFRRIVTGASRWGWVNRDFSVMNFVPIFAKKSENSVGLQLADLTARPLAINMLRPDQSNRAYEIILTKLINLKTFP
jgi:hypothetical protein